MIIDKKRPRLNLIVPGIDGSGRDHWQTRWEAYGDCLKVELGDWARPEPGAWMARLDDAVAAHHGADIALVAHSLGCILVAWWARHCSEAARHVVAALLVAPCNPSGDRDPRLRSFAPVPEAPLPFRTGVVASRDDPYATFAWSSHFARSIGAELHDAGHLGHINCDSDIGAWPAGRLLLDELLSFGPGPSRDSSASPAGLAGGKSGVDERACFAVGGHGFRHER
jgi:predicted alpha/beta hydrolase family esterase